MVLILTSPRDVKGGVEKRLGAYHLTALALNKTKFAPMITSNLCLHFFWFTLDPSSERHNQSLEFWFTTAKLLLYKSIRYLGLFLVNIYLFCSFCLF